MTLLTVVTVLALVVLFARRDQVAWGQLVLGMVVTFLLLGTFAGPHLQAFVGGIGQGLENTITGIWHDAWH